MARFQIMVTLTVEADNDSQAWSMAEAVLDNVAQWDPMGDILACEVDEVSPDRPGRLKLTDLDNTLD